MNSIFKRIGLFIRKDDPIMESAIVRVTDFLQSRALNIFINEPLGFLPELDVISINDFPKNCDLTIAIGGDGTLLSASRALSGTNLPLVGINVGRFRNDAEAFVAEQSNLRAHVGLLSNRGRTGGFRRDAEIAAHCFPPFEGRAENP